MKRVFYFLLLFFPSLLRGDLFFVDGSMLLVNATASFIDTIDISQVEDNTRVLYYPFTSFTNATNKQIVSHYLPKVSPKPDSIKIYKDKLGNKVIEYFFNRLFTGSIKVESEFVLDNELSSFSPDNFYEYPIPSSMLKSVKIYLSGTKRTSFDKSIKSLVLSLIKGNDTQFNVVLRVLAWVRQNIRLNLHKETSDAKTVFLLREGNYDDILNLSLSMLRVANIPCRFVHGFSINKSFKFVNQEELVRNDFDNRKVFLAPFDQQDNFEIIYPKSSYNWIEVYFPNLHWASFDIFSSYFFVSSNLIRRNISLDSMGSRSRAYSGLSDDSVKKSLPILSKYFVSSTRENDRLKALSYKKSLEFLMFPMFDKEKHSFVNGLFSLDDEIIDSGFDGKGNDLDGGLLFSFNPYSLEFDDGLKQLELRLTSLSPYSQGFYVDKAFVLDKVSLPLFRFNNYPLGKVWVEIRRDGDDNFVLKSDEREVSDLNNSGFYSFIFFFFPSHPSLKRGNYSLSLKSSTEEIILWRGVFGNPYYKKKDTFYLSRGVKTFVYLDLCFRFYDIVKKAKKPKSLPK